MLELELEEEGQEQDQEQDSTASNSEADEPDLGQLLNTLSESDQHPDPAEGATSTSTFHGIGTDVDDVSVGDEELIGDIGTDVDVGVGDDDEELIGDARRGVGVA